MGHFRGWKWQIYQIWLLQKYIVGFLCYICVPKQHSGPLKFQNSHYSIRRNIEYNQTLVQGFVAFGYTEAFNLVLDCIFPPI